MKREEGHRELDLVPSAVMHRMTNIESAELSFLADLSF